MILPEIISAGIFDSSFANKNTTISKKRKTTMFEIELPLEVGGISYIDSASISIEPNMLIFAKPDQERYTKFPYKCLFVKILVEDETLLEILLNTPNFINTSDYEVYNRIFNRLTKHYNFPSNNDELILQSLVLELIYKIGNEKRLTAFNRRIKDNDKIIENAVRYIKSNLTEELTLEGVAKKMSVSPIYFHKIFKTSMGKTIRDYIEEQRIKRAVYLLQTTDYTLTRIAYECGFSSQSYFSYVFKRRMKQTPREYIRKIYDKYQI